MIDNTSDHNLPKPAKASTMVYVFTLLAGILLPAITLALELFTGMCAAELFDPLPTVWHTLLIAFVPLTNLQVWLAIKRRKLARGKLLGWANAVAIGITLYYSLVFMSVTPIAFVAILFGGLGLLPLAPLLSFISALLLRRRLRVAVGRMTATTWKGALAGIAVAFALLVTVEIPATLTRIGMEMATSDQPERIARGMQILRFAGSREHVLRSCYERTGMAADPISFLFTLGSNVTPNDAREVYYRLSGQSYDSVAPPRLAGRTNPLAERDFDFEQGGEIVAGKLRGLSLADSRMDGSLDADAALGYMEWTLVFKNTSETQREARAQVQLPTGGVVSRLTLWVNGEEREAAFAGRKQVREAYEQVVRTRRDPVLVTTAGEDKVLVQCFPVPSNGEMKIRLGITVPLALANREHAALRLPYFVERNFDVKSDFRHTVWVESKQFVEAANHQLNPEQPNADLFAIRGKIGDAELIEPTATIRAKRNANVTTSRTVLPASVGATFTQNIIEENMPRFKSITLVVDGSSLMQPFIKEIADSISALPQDTEIRLIIAGDKVVEATAPASLDAAGRRMFIVNSLREIECAGGADNVTALERAWDVAAGLPEAVIVWVHAPQPVLLSSVEGLQQRWERRPSSAPLIAVAVTNKANRILEKLDGINAVGTHVRLGDLKTDLRDLFGSFSGDAKRLRLVRERLPAAEMRDGNQAKETSSHLARLWAKDEVERLIDANNTDEATKIAAQYQLVTPVSGAVVLENQEQYKRAGLQPVDAGSVPTIPEPEIVLLIVVTALLMLWTLWNRTRKGAAQTRG